MDKLKVSTEELRKTAVSIDNLAAEYESEYNALLEDVVTLTTTDYVGEDATAFREQVEGFKEDFVKMRQLMNEYADFFRHAAASYEDNVENVKNTISSLQN